MDRQNAIAKHDLIANFVARLSERAHDKELTRQFLDDMISQNQAEFDVAKNQWTITLW